MTRDGNDGIRDKIAVGWLKEVIGSLRTEMQSVWSAINETARIRRTVAVQNDLQALRKDLDSDRRDLQTMQGELLSVRKNVEDIAAKHSELEKKIDNAVKRQYAIDKVRMCTIFFVSFFHRILLVLFKYDTYLYSIQRKLYYVLFLLLYRRRKKKMFGRFYDLR